MSSSGWLFATHAAPIPAEPTAASAGRILLEDVIAMTSAQGFVEIGLARCPGNPQYRRPSISFLALPGHLLLPPSIPKRGGETPGWKSLTAGAPPWGWSGVSPPLPLGPGRRPPPMP